MDDEQVRRKKRALIAFQIYVYGWLLVNFLIQLHMSMTRNWG
jgi:hypothetical protein